MQLAKPSGSASRTQKLFLLGDSGCLLVANNCGTVTQTTQAHRAQASRPRLHRATFPWRTKTDKTTSARRHERQHLALAIPSVVVRRRRCRRRRRRSFVVSCVYLVILVSHEATKPQSRPRKPSAVDQRTRGRTNYVFSALTLSLLSKQRVTVFISRRHHPRTRSSLF